MADESVRVTHASRGTSSVRKAVLIYRAIAHRTIEAVNMTVNPGVSLDQAWAILKEAPPWVRTGWSPSLTGTRQKDVFVLGLSRIKAMLDVSTSFPDGTSKELREMLEERFPDLANPANAEMFPQIRIEASVDQDGETSWGYVIERPGTLPASLANIGPADQADRSAFEVFLINLLRADLVKRIEDLHK